MRFAQRARVARFPKDVPKAVRMTDEAMTPTSGENDSVSDRNYVCAHFGGDRHTELDRRVREHVARTAAQADGRP